MSDTFSINGIDGFKLRYKNTGSPGGQQVGIQPSQIEIYHEDLGLSACCTNRNQMKARNRCIFMISQYIWAIRNCTGDEIRAEVQSALETKESK